MARSRSKDATRFRSANLATSPTPASTRAAKIGPRDVVGKTRRRLAAEKAAELVAVEKKIKALIEELTAMVQDSGSTLMELPGV